MAAQIGGELEAAAELRLRGCEISAHEQSRDPKVALRHECRVAVLLHGGDGGSEALDRVVVPTLIVAHEGGEHERDLDPERSIFGQACQPLRLGEPLVRLWDAPLPLVDVTEQEQRL